MTALQGSYHDILASLVKPFQVVMFQPGQAAHGRFILGQNHGKPGFLSGPSINSDSEDIGVFAFLKQARGHCAQIFQPATFLMQFPEAQKQGVIRFRKISPNGLLKEAGTKGSLKCSSPVVAHDRDFVYPDGGFFFSHGRLLSAEPGSGKAWFGRTSDF